MKTVCNPLPLPYSKLAGSSVLLLLGALVTPAANGQTLVVGTFDEDRNGPANVFDGHWTGAIRASLDDYRVKVGFDEILIIGTGELTEGFVEDVDMLLLHNGKDLTHGIDPPLSDTEQIVLFDFVVDGGTALILADGGLWATAPAFVEPFGVEYDHHTEGIDDGDVEEDASSHLVVAGPFGVVSTLKTNWAGWFEDLGPWAESLAILNENGKPSLAVIEADEIAPGSGRVVLMTDVAPFADSALDPANFGFDEHETLFLNIMAWLSSETSPPDPIFLRGDCNDDAIVDLSDAVDILNFLFLGGDEPPCPKSCDADDTGELQLTDAVYLLGFLFLGGPAPPAPFPACDPDSTDDGLGCVSYAGCGEVR